MNGLYNFHDAKKKIQVIMIAMAEKELRKKLHTDWRRIKCVAEYEQ